MSPPAAAVHGHAETVTVLLAAPGLEVNAATGDGETALTRAARGGHTAHTEIVTALLAAPGLDVNAVRGDGYATLIWIAAALGHTEMVTALLAAPGLDFDVNATNGDGTTALALAAEAQLRYGLT